MSVSLKESAINNYIGNLNLRQEDLNLNQIEQDLIKLLGERPSVQPKWVRDAMLLEDRKSAREIKRLDSISIIFTDLDDKIKKIEIKI